MSVFVYLIFAKYFCWNLSLAITFKLICEREREITFIILQKRALLKKIIHFIIFSMENKKYYICSIKTNTCNRLGSFINTNKTLISAKDRYSHNIQIKCLPQITFNGIISRRLRKVSHHTE